jgi:hypothetical protein
LLSSVSDLTPNVAWLSAVASKALGGGSSQVGLVDVACKDLALKVNQLIGEVLQLEAQAVEVDTNEVFIVDNDQIQTIEAPSVVVIAKGNNLEDLKDIEVALRAALAETIVARAEAEGILPREDGSPVQARVGACGPSIDQRILDSLNPADPPEINCEGCVTGRMKMTTTGGEQSCSCPK